MARIPQFEPRQIDIDPTVGAGVPTPEIMEPQRSPLEETGVAVQALGEGLQRAFQMQQKREADKFTAQATSSLMETSMRDLGQRKFQSIKNRNVEGFTDNFISNFDNQAQALLENAPNDLARQQLGQRLQQTRTNFLNQSINFESTQKIRLYEQALKESANNYSKFTKGTDIPGLDGVLKWFEDDTQKAKENLGLPEEQAETIRKGGKGQIIGSAIENNLRDDPAKAKEIFETFKDDPDLDESNFDAETLENRIAAKEEQIKQAQIETEQRLNREARVHAHFNGFIIDPKNKNDQRALDEFYVRIKQADPLFNFMPIVESTKIMPDTLKRDLRSMLVSGNATQQVHAAQQLNLIHNNVPSVEMGFSDKDLMKAHLISEYIDSGVSPSRAIEIADKESSLPTSSEREFKERRLNNNESPELMWEHVADDFTSLFGADEAAIPFAMRGDYERKARVYYLNTGADAEKASELAVRDLRRKWSLTEVGDEIAYIPKAPELVFNDDMAPGWIKEQFDQEVGIIPGDDREIAIFPDPKVTRNGLPTYRIFLQDRRNGNIEVVRDPVTNRPRLWQPDFETSLAFQRMLEREEGKTIEEKKENFNARMRRSYELHKQLQELPDEDFLRTPPIIPLAQPFLDEGL